MFDTLALSVKLVEDKTVWMYVNCLTSIRAFWVIAVSLTVNEEATNNMLRSYLKLQWHGKVVKCHDEDK
jgi:hypothetical protein